MVVIVGSLKRESRNLFLNMSFSSPTDLKRKFPVTYIFLLTADHPPACSTAEDREWINLK